MAALPVLLLLLGIVRLVGYLSIGIGLSTNYPLSLEALSKPHRLFTNGCLRNRSILEYCQIRMNGDLLSTCRHPID